MTGTRRNIYINDETSQALKDIGGGNRSKGIQIAGGYHGRLVEASQKYRDTVEAAHRARCGCGKLNQALAAQEIAEREIDALLTEIAEAWK